MKILYISRNVFPYGSAYASRVTHFAKMLHDMGHSVHIISDYTLDPEVQIGQVVQLGFCSYQACTTLGLRGRLEVNKKRYISIKKYLDTVPTDYIITDIFTFDYKKLKGLMVQKKIPYVVEVCEWYDFSNYKFGKFDIRYRINDKTLRTKYVKEDKIIAISRYLQNYYIEHGVNCIRIPTILDMNEYRFNEDFESDKLKLMYAGNPGKSKELLREIFRAIQDLKREDDQFSKKFSFDIYGVSEAQVLRNIENDIELLKNIQDCIHIKGKVKQEIMNTVYLEHNFSIFMRPHRRSSEAGFPTKLAESLAAGTPVLANSTGDISCYINNGINGFLLENEKKALKEMFSYLLTMNKAEYLEMRKNARKTAEQNFDYRIYEEEVGKFIYE